MRLNAIHENALLGRWWDFLRRAPHQANAPHECDAELVPLDGGGMLAMTIDTISEECALGFYTEPETIGWMGATVSLSDLAATGAQPLGVLVSVTLRDAAAQEGIARGLDAACRAAGTWVLGGDTNFGAAPAITTAAVGLVQNPMRRIGCRPGDLVYATGPLGAGAWCAARALFGLPHPESEYRPCARIAAGRTLAGVASACIDSSDGLIAALDQLARLNGVGIEISRPPEELLESRVVRMCRDLRISPWLPLAQQHGEFELVCTVPEERAPGVAGALAVGRVTADGVVRAGTRVFDTARIRNALGDAGGDPRVYFERLREALPCES